jgi:hypothetical protein
MADAIVEPHAGGRWYERGTDGSECDWGRVLARDPLRRLAVTWQVNGQWQYDPDPAHAGMTDGQRRSRHVRVSLCSFRYESTLGHLVTLTYQRPAYIAGIRRTQTAPRGAARRAVGNRDTRPLKLQEG